MPSTNDASAAAAIYSSNPTGIISGASFTVWRRNVAVPARPSVSGAGCANPPTEITFAVPTTWSGFGSGAKPIPANGSEPNRVQNRFNLLKTRRLAPERLLVTYPASLPLRYKISSSPNTPLLWA